MIYLLIKLQQLNIYKITVRPRQESRPNRQFWNNRQNRITPPFIDKK